MKYRSSVTTFAKALLSEAALYNKESIEYIQRRMAANETSFAEALESVLGNEEYKLIQAAKQSIPEDDWKEIVAYLHRFYNAYGFQLVMPGRRGPLYAFLPWLASIAVCALDDIGR